MTRVRGQPEEGPRGGGGAGGGVVDTRDTTLASYGATCSAASLRISSQVGQATPRPATRRHASDNDTVAGHARMIEQISRHAEADHHTRWRRAHKNNTIALHVGSGTLLR